MISKKANRYERNGNNLEIFIRKIENENKYIYDRLVTTCIVLEVMLYLYLRLKIGFVFVQTFISVRFLSILVEAPLY